MEEREKNSNIGDLNWVIWIITANVNNLNIPSRDCQLDK